MKYTVASDIHFFGADPLENITLPSEAILTGDIVDLKNCHYKDLQSATNYYRKLKEIYGERYLNGNHECQKDADKPYIINGIGFIHGDSIAYGYVESQNVRSKKIGAGIIERWFKKKFSQGRRLTDFTESDLNKYVVELRRFFYAYKVHTLVMGHIHPNKLIDAKLPFGRVIVVPRGITEIEI